MSGLAAAMGMLDQAQDLGDTVLDCAVPVEILRYSAPATVKGRVQPAKAQKLLTSLAIQALSSRELKLLPEGMRGHERVKAYGTAELFTVKTSECKLPDRFVYKGHTYQIDKAADWNDVGGYYRYEAVRVGQ